jgi:hypothetical protein
MGETPIREIKKTAMKDSQPTTARHRLPRNSRAASLRVKSLVSDVGRHCPPPKLEDQTMGRQVDFALQAAQAQQFFDFCRLEAAGSSSINVKLNHRDGTSALRCRGSLRTRSRGSLD